MHSFELRWLACALAASAVSVRGAPPLAAQGSRLFGLDAFGSLYDVDAFTGAAANPRATGASILAGVAADVDGSVYVLTTFGSSPANALLRVDPATGATTLVGATGLQQVFEGDLAIDPTSGILYGVQQVTANFALRLFTLSKATGQAALVGTVSVGQNDLSALAFDSQGTLYVLDSDLDLIYTVDKATAAVQASAPLAVPLGTTVGMAFDPLTNALYVADGLSGGTDALYTLDPGTGAMALVGDTGLANGLAGLTFFACATTAAASEVPRAGTPPNPLALLPGATGRPLVGTSWDPLVDHASFVPGAILDIFAISTTPANVPTAIGTALCDPTGPAILLLGPPGLPIEVPIPLRCGLVGATFCVQAASSDFFSVALTNALDVTVGTF